MKDYKLIASAFISVGIFQLIIGILNTSMVQVIVGGMYCFFGWLYIKKDKEK